MPMAMQTATVKPTAIIKTICGGFLRHNRKINKINLLDKFQFIINYKKQRIFKFFAFYIPYGKCAIALFLF